MKVGYVLKRYPRLSETFVVNEILGLEAHGVDVMIHALGFPEDPRFHPSLSMVAAEVLYVPSPGRSASIAAAHDMMRSPERLAAFPQVMAFLDLIDPRYRTDLLISGLHVAVSAATHGIDHLHAHFMTIAAHVAYVANLFSGIPFSVTAHAKDIFRVSVDGIVFREVAEAAETVITVSDYNVDFVRRRFLSGSPARVDRVYNGFDTSQRVRRDSRDDRLVLCVGRLVEKKGIHLVVDAMSDLPDDTRLVIIGDGEERARIDNRVDVLGVRDRVQMLGAQPSDVVEAWMARASVLAAPFVVGADGNQDALPTVLIEALAAGLPVVAADIAGVPEIVDDGETGLVVPTGDQEAFVAALQRLIGPSELASAMSRRGPAIARARFDRDVTVPQWLRAVGLGAQRPPTIARERSAAVPS